MHRVILTVFLAGLFLLPLAQTGYAYDAPNKYGLQLGGGFGIYDMGDVTQGTQYMLNQGPGNTLTEADSGPMGSLALLYRPGKHQLWEFGFNPILGVENLVENPGADTTGQILMHANEFYIKANAVAVLASRLHLSLGAGLAYYNVEVQVQNDFNRSYAYDAVARAFGLLGSAGLEVGLTERIGLYLGGGGRLTNATNFSYESTPGVRTFLAVPGGSRPMEVNLSGVFGLVAFRFYFDKVTRPIDFTE
jgi:hypothetical protein